MRHLPFALLLSLALLAAPALAEEPTETWERIHMAGAHAGWLHRTQRRVDDGDSSRIETSEVSKISMKRLGTPTEIEASSATWETLDGDLLRIEVEAKMSAQTSYSVFTFEDGKVTIAKTVMGQTRTVTRDVPAELPGPRGVERLTKALAGTSGESLLIVSFLADLEQVVKTAMTSKGQETIGLPDGRERVLTRIDCVIMTEAGMPIGMNPTLWIDGEGQSIKTEMKAAGLLIESFRVADEASAKAEGEAIELARPDLMLETLLHEADPIPVPRRLTGARILVRPKDPARALPDLSSVAHDVLEREDGTLDIYARRAVPRPGRTGQRPLQDAPDSLADALAASSAIQSDAEAIQEIVAEVVGDEPDAWKAAQALERWVFENVTKKSMGVAFASALEVCETREGDCTEHAVLLAALGRAAGIPTRVVMGLEYVYGVWGGHAWNEVYIDGEWYPLDATNGLGFADPLHLPMAHMTMKDGGGTEFVAILQGMGNMEVDIVAVERGDRWIEVGDPSLVTAADGGYRNEVLGIAFAVPPGLELERSSRGRGLSARLLELDGEAEGLDQVEIEVDVLDAPPGDGWTWLMKQGLPESASVTAITVDGRPARKVVEPRGERTRERVAVLYDGALWIFSLDRAGIAGARDVFEAFLASVDFDVP